MPLWLVEVVEIVLVDIVVVLRWLLCVDVGGQKLSTGPARLHLLGFHISGETGLQVATMRAQSATDARTLFLKLGALVLNPQQLVLEVLDVIIRRHVRSPIFFVRLVEWM